MRLISTDTWSVFISHPGERKPHRLPQYVPFQGRLSRYSLSTRRGQEGPPPAGRCPCRLLTRISQHGTCGFRGASWPQFIVAGHFDGPLLPPRLWFGRRGNRQIDNISFPFAAFIFIRVHLFQWGWPPHMGLRIATYLITALLPKHNDIWSSPSQLPCAGDLSHHRVNNPHSSFYLSPHSC
jgi:hypothetical protein